MLVRLLEHLKEDYFPVYFDIEHNLDSHKANQIDLLYLLGATIYQVAVQEGLQPEPANLTELAQSVYTLTLKVQDASKEALNVGELTKGLVCFGARLLGGELAEKLAGAALKPFTLSSQVNEEQARKREIEPQVQQIVNNVNLIIGDVRGLAGKPLLVVVDGLDKLQEQQQVELIYLKSRALLGPVCHIIYTVPMLIFHSLPFGQTEEDCRLFVCPNVRLSSKLSDQEQHARGYDTMRDIVGKRLKAIGLHSDDVFAAGVLDLLIAKSGGVVRWLISLAQDSCLKAQLLGLDRVEPEAARRAVDDRAAELGQRLTTEAIEELQKVRQHKRLSGSVKSGELLHALLILAYRDPGTWFDAHPLIWDEL
jgi:hypothetical protein